MCAELLRFSLVSLVPGTIDGVFPLGGAPGSQGEDPYLLTMLQAEGKAQSLSQRTGSDSFSHSLSRHLLSVSCMPGTAPGARNANKSSFLTFSCSGLRTDSDGDGGGGMFSQGIGLGSVEIFL